MRRNLVVPLLVVAAALCLTVDERVFGLLTDGQVMTRTAVAMAELGEIGVARGHQVDVVRPAGDAVTRYGIGASLVQVLPVALAARLDPRFGPGASQTLFAIQQIVLVLLAVWGAGVLGTAWGGPVAGRRAVLAAGLASPLWAYVSSDFSEPLQAALVAGTFALGVSAARAGTPRRGALLAALAGSCAGFGLLTKSILVILLPLLLLALVPGAPRAERRRLGGAAVAGWAVLAALWLAFEVIRFGRPFASYAGEPFSHPLLDGLWRLTVGLNKGLLVYFPLTLLSVVGLVLLFRADRAATLACGGFAALLLVTAACWWAWDGTAGWGPRLLVPALPLLAALAALASTHVNPLAFRTLFAAGVAVNLIGALVPDALTTFYYGVLPGRVLEARELSRYPPFAYEQGPDGRARLYPVHDAHTHAEVAPLRVAPWLLRTRLRGEDLLVALRTPPWSTADGGLGPARPLEEAIPSTALAFLTSPYRWPHLGMSLRGGPGRRDTAFAYVDGLYDQALRAQDMGRADRAAAFGERIYRLVPSPQTAVAYAEGLRLAGRRDDFVALFGRLPREHKVLPELGIVMALYSRDAGDETRARMILETVLRAAPRPAYVRLASVSPREWPPLRDLTRPAPVAAPSPAGGAGVSAEPSGGTPSSASGG